MSGLRPVVLRRESNNLSKNTFFLQDREQFDFEVRIAMSATMDTAPGNSRLLKK